jgi:acetyltransferase-like isoleucine patch superfamily enzyme
MSSGCIVGEGVRVELRGGSLLMGEGVDLRPRCTLDLSGRLELKGANVLQYGTTVHCDESVTVDRTASMGEYTTLVDSSHTYDGPHEWFGHNVITAPIYIGENAWLGAKATVGRGVRIGERAVIGANSMVVKDVPAGWLASGVPAQLVRDLAGTAGGDAVHLPGQFSRCRLPN